MTPLEKCEKTIQAALEELEQSTGHPVLVCSLIAWTADGLTTYMEDCKAVSKTVSIGLMITGSINRLPWREKKYG